MTNYSFLDYSEASKLCIKNKITNRSEYRLFRKSNNFNLPCNPPETRDWEDKWTNWDDFLRDPLLIPKRSKLITNHYYLYKGKVFHHTSKGFIELKSRLMDKHYYTEIRLSKGKIKNIRVSK